MATSIRKCFRELCQKPDREGGRVSIYRASNEAFMSVPLLIDAAPDPVSVGVMLAVVLFIIAAVILIAGALVFFLWYRKRRMRHVEMIRSAGALSTEAAQSNNQP